MAQNNTSWTVKIRRSGASVLLALPEELPAQVVPEKDLVDVSPGGLLAHHQTEMAKVTLD